ncbi:Uncharacterised protein [uncultured archaeon]|nr:Uncharacterised protein [uncultured archaeon]
MPPPQEPEIRTGREHPAGQMHNRLVTQIAICQDASIDLTTLDDTLQIILRPDGKTMWIQPAAKLGWIETKSNARYLGRSEPHHLVLGIMAKEDIEIMKVPSSSAKDQNTLSFPDLIANRHRSHRIH